MGSAGLMGNVYYNGIYFDILYPMWFKTFVLRIVNTAVTWARCFQKIWTYKCIRFLMIELILSQDFTI